MNRVSEIIAAMPINKAKLRNMILDRIERFSFILLSLQYFHSWGLASP